MPILSNQRHELFAQGIAEGLASGEAYKKAGFNGKGADASACRLLKKSEILARIAELNAKVSVNVTESFVSGQVRDRVYRLVVLDDLLGRMRALVAARAKNLASVPGGETGMLIRRLKVLGRGAAAREVEEYEFDAALVQQIRETTKEISVEVGQRTEKQDLTIRPGAPAEDLSRVPLEVLLAAREKLLEADRMLIEAAPGSVAEVSEACNTKEPDSDSVDS